MNETSNGMKLLLSYNIRPGNSQAYYEFVLGRYVPIMQALGFEMSEAWHTAYGDYPNRLVGFVSRDRELMMELFHNETWLELNEQLMEHVTDFSYKVVPYALGFQI